MSIEYESLRFDSDGAIPNNPRLAARVYRNVLRGHGDRETQARALFEAHGWPPAWTNGVFAYWHYHAQAHEALGVIAGHARLGLGGDAGAEVDVGAGDVVLIPAGVGHRRLSASRDFQVVGAYPPGQSPDMNTDRRDKHDAALALIRALPDPDSDPVFGAAAPPD